MKILMVSTRDIIGGAARAAYRLHESLNEMIGISSTMLVRSKKSQNENVIQFKPQSNKIVLKAINYLNEKSLIKYKCRSQSPFSAHLFGLPGIVDTINSFNADIVHLHWINGLLAIEDIPKINAPVVWTVHDMWPFTGGCHYNEWCEGYKSNCSICKVLNDSNKNNLSNRTLKRKINAFSKIKSLKILGPSKWVCAEAKKSTLFANLEIINIPHPIDTNTFAPYSKNASRELLQLPKDKKLIIFGAINATDDPRKGYNELKEALNILDEKNTELIIFGSKNPNKPLSPKLKIHFMGNINDDRLLRALFSSADMAVIPSIQEAFGLTACESMSCGIPVVAFAATGLLDIVDHKINGYLAQPYLPVDLANGIKWVLNHPNQELLSLYAREKVINTFEKKIVAKFFIEFYGQEHSTKFI